MISNGCPYADSEVLIKRLGKDLLPTARAWGRGRQCLPVAAPCARASHTYLVCDLGPAQVLVTKLQDLIGGGGMSGRAAATHGDAGLAKLIAHRGPGTSQLGSDLAQGPALAVQVGCTVHFHSATVARSCAGVTSVGPFRNRAGLTRSIDADLSRRMVEPGEPVR
jgi:hypothetical protein